MNLSTSYPQPLRIANSVSDDKLTILINSYPHIHIAYYKYFNTIINCKDYY